MSDAFHVLSLIRSVFFFAIDVLYMYMIYMMYIIYIICQCIHTPSNLYDICIPRANICEYMTHMFIHICSGMAGSALTGPRSHSVVIIIPIQNAV